MRLRFLRLLAVALATFPALAQPPPPPSSEEQNDPPEEMPEEAAPGSAGIRHVEEVQVTGSVIRETPIDSPSSVAVVTRNIIGQQGSPQLVDLFKNLTVSSGVVGEVNSWFAGAGASLPETIANVNLRGLGASRTLVLINGRRTAGVPVKLPGGRFVDINTIPSVAIARLDILKEGAGAIYGSDAIGGVVNFITRSDFEGLELNVSHEAFTGAGDSAASGIWGRRFGETNVMAAVEYQNRSRLSAGERDWVLRDYPNWGWGWSGTGNPGAFIVPSGATGSDAASLAAAPRFLDPQCAALGGHPDQQARTCRFRYQQWDDLIAPTRHLRSVVEAHGHFGETGWFQIEGLYADARTPEWRTTPSFPPIALFDGLQIVQPDHPGRRALVASLPSVAAASGAMLDLANSSEPWYFFGRLAGNSGPGRLLDRGNATGRIAASMGGEIGRAGFGYDLGAVYARSSSAVPIPAEYAWRKFLAFRGYGGPDCGVDVELDPASPSRMALGPIPAGVVAGQGSCHYFNPFGNAIQFSEQPGAAFENTPNPQYAAALGNAPELLDWIHEKVEMHGVSDIFTTDVTITKELSGNATVAAGHQFRRVSARAEPNAAGNLGFHPCQTPGDRGCTVHTGPFTFTSAQNPYSASQQTHAVFSELALSVGDALDLQAAAHYETTEFAGSFDPKLAAIWKISDTLSLRGTVQTTFRTPSLDDVNEDISTFQDWVAASGTWKAIDDSGDRSLVPEEAFHYNIGILLGGDAAVEAALDFWSFDLDNPIGTIPNAGLAAAYANPATRSRVQQFITCPGGLTDGSCDPVDIERIRIRRINWPGLTTSGFDWHVGARRVMGNGALVGALDGSFTLDYTVESLEVSGVVVHQGEQGAGYLNRNNPLAPPLPRLRAHALVSWLESGFTLTGAARAISGYKDRATTREYADIAPWLTFDATAQYNWPDSGLTLTGSALNLAGSVPPLVRQELAYDSLTHNPKGRRLKMSLGYRF